MNNRPVLLLLLVLLASGCGIGDRSPDLDGEWELVNATVDGTPLQLIARAPVSLAIDGSTVGGIAACNQYGGELDRDGGHISFGAMTMTEMGCEEPIMALESAYVAGLGRVEAVARDGDRLRLTGPGVELDYALVPPLADADPVGTNWKLESLLSGDAVSSVVGEATLRLDADGTLSGSSGCRGFGASYQVDGETLEVNDWVIDMTNCDEATASQDEHVHAVFEGPITMVVNGDRLTLMAGERGLDYRVGD